MKPRWKVVSSAEPLFTVCRKIRADQPMQSSNIEYPKGKHLFDCRAEAEALASALNKAEGFADA